MSLPAPKFRRIALLALCLIAGRALAGTDVHIAPPSEWVEPLASPPLAPTPAADLSHGYDYLLIHRQVNVAEESHYFRAVYRITSEGSLQSGARLSWDYDPTYQQLTLHHLRVIRGEETQDRLNAAAVKTIQQERDLDRHLLNGDLTAFVLLEDVRVGDVIDYAFTQQGWNPTFGGLYFDRQSTTWSVPVRRLRFRLDVPEGRTIARRAHGEIAATPAVEQAKGVWSSVWELNGARPIESEAECPDWYDEYPFIQFSEFDTWGRVVDWALPLYAVAEPLAPELQEKAEELVRGLESADAKAVALLQFVQQEVRYLGLELGAGSYRPTPPAEVLARRFGDCKDKTLLFCTLMRAVGLTAHPALLHSDYRRKVEDWLPTPFAFDHVIACIPSDGGFVWVDPTLTYQQGDLTRRGLPDYERALIVRPGMDRLTEIELPAGARRSLRIEETFDIPAFDAPAKFEVVTRATGLSADSARRYFAQNTPEQIAKQYVNYYASAYPGIVSTRAVTWNDDRVQNIVTSVELYEVPNLWQKSDQGGIRAEFYPKNISDYTTRPQTSVRSTPLALTHPVDVELTTTVNLPEDWSVTPEDTVTEGGVFRASAGISGQGRVVTMRYTWKSQADHVPVAEVPAYVKTLSTYRDSLGYSLTHASPSGATKPNAEPTAPARHFRLNWLLVLVSLVSVTLAVAAAVWVFRWQPQAPPPVHPPEENALVGLRGWLVLVGIGVTLRPFVLLGQMLVGGEHAFNQDVWEAMTIPGGGSYQAGLGPLIMAELIGNIIQVVTSALALVLFYARKRAFPAVFIFMAGLGVVLQAADLWAGHTLVEGADTNPKELARAVGQAVVWIPYMLVSRRVKATFTR